MFAILEDLSVEIKLSDEEPPLSKVHEDVSPVRTPVSFEKNTVHFSRRKTGDKEYEIIAKVRQKPEGLPDSFYEEGDFHGSWITVEVHRTHDDAISAIKKLRA